MTKTHEHLQRSWDLFNETGVQGDFNDKMFLEVPPQAFIELWKAVDEICKRVDKIEAMIGCAQALDAEVEATALALKEYIENQRIKP